MAQEARRARARGVARRYGVAAALAALLAALALAAGVALAAGAATGGAGVEIERAEEAPDEGAGERGEGDADERDAGEGGGGSPDEGDGAAEGDGEGAPGDGTAPGTVVVHVVGAVAAPGVYALPAGARANDAILAAGGLSEGADTTGVNLAAPLVDGEKLHVPREGERASAAAGDVAGDAAGGGADSTPAAPVNLNTAGVEELDALPGVGEATARAIIEDRERNGPFSTPEDLMRVSGIGEKKFAKIEAMVCV